MSQHYGKIVRGVKVREDPSERKDQEGKKGSNAG